MIITFTGSGIVEKISGLPQLFKMIVALGEKEKKRGDLLVPQSNISYKTIKSNKTLFDCCPKDSFEAEKEEEIKE